jgi:cell cycle arrest protein BUB3
METRYPSVYHFSYLLSFVSSGGCDGSVFIWDAMKKKKLTSIPSLPTSISSLAFNHDGSEIAIASSYTHEEGDRDHPQDEIFIRKILESECQKRI